MDAVMHAPNGSEMPVIAMTGITKEYPSVRALNDVSLVLRRGEVHALVGENGAGKSTLIRILCGDARPDAGTISINSTDVAFSSPADARRHGIVAIFQELMIVPDLSVAENVLLGSEPGLGGVFYSRRETERRAAAISIVSESGLQSIPRGWPDNCPRRRSRSLRWPARSCCRCR